MNCAVTMLGIRIAARRLPCPHDARWQAEVWHGFGLRQRALCDYHLGQYRKLGIVKEYRPLEVTTARQSA